MSTERCSFSILSDIHSYYDVSMRAIESELAHSDAVIIAGDIVDGPDTKQMIESIRSLGDKVICIAGNHEWVLRNALSRHAFAGAWREEVWARYHYKTMQSYGIEPTGKWRDNATMLRESLEDNDHLAWLNHLRPYYSNSDFIVVHAGPQPRYSWELQAEQLNEYDASDEGRLTAEPPQVFSIELARMREILPHVDHRLFITGHDHVDASVETRISKQRVRIGSKVHHGAPLYAWRHNEERIIAYPQ